MLPVPLVHSLQRLSLRKDCGAIVLYAVLAAVYSMVACLPVSPAVQEIQARKYHLALNPFGEWAAFQFVPAIYNFENSIDMTFDPMGENILFAPQAQVHRTAANHFPLHIMYYAADRKRLVIPVPFYVYVRSKYRGREWLTFYSISSRDGSIHMQIGRTYEFDMR